MNRLVLAGLVLVGAPVLSAGYLAAAEWFMRGVSPRRRYVLRPWLWMGPALLFVSIFLLYPMVHTIALSLADSSDRHWVGVANYAAALHDPATIVAIRNNVVWLVAFTGTTVIGGLLIAILADRVRYEAVVKAIVFLPMALSFTAAGVIWKFIYEYRPASTPQIGLLNAVLLAIAPHAPPRAWLIESPQNTLGLIAAGVWTWTGFCAVVLSAALKAVPRATLDAARVDGAGDVQILLRVTLPAIGPTIAVVVTTMVITALKVFDIVYVMTSGDFGTDVLANEMYREMFIFQQFERASVIAVILLAAAVPIMVVNIRRLRGQEALR